ncbi:MAG: O-antigen ligase family protein [Propionibacteriaceae bacterium]|jgi:O-antigen ligase|nr:O-antigen ligase family protein [Propionibacteriaceae bacterium]
MTGVVKAADRMPFAVAFAVFFLVAEDTLRLVGIQGVVTVVMVVTLSLVAIRVLGDDLKWGRHLGWWPTTLFVVWAGVRLLMVGPTVIGLQEFCVWALYPLVIGTVSQRAQPGTYERVCPWLVGAAALAAVVYLGQVALAGAGADQFYSARGAGWLALLGLTIVLPRVVACHKPWWPVPLLTAVIVLSQSRTPMVIAGAMLVVTWAFRHRRGVAPTWRRVFLRLVIAGVIVVGLLAWLVLNVSWVQSRFTEGDGFSINGVVINLSGRATLWQLTIEQWLLDPWIGNGPGAVGTMLATYGPDYPDHPHNEYLRLLDDTGVIGLVLWLAGVVLVGWRSLRALSRAQSPKSVAVSTSAVLGVLVMLAGSVTDNVTISLYIPLITGVMIGLSLADQRHTTDAMVWAESIPGGTSQSVQLPVDEVESQSVLSRARRLIPGQRLIGEASSVTPRPRRQYVS